MTTAHDLPLDRLDAWLRSHVEGFRGPLAAERFTGGQSNPTYKLEAASGLYVLRRKPPGPLLPSAHAVDREFRVMGALAETQVPVPRVYALCEDDGVIGSAFYVMQFLDGRIFWEQRLPEVMPAERRAMFDSMNAVIAALLSDTLGKDPDKDSKDSAVEGTIRVFLGGPVQPEYGFVIHGTDYRRPETLLVGDALAMTATKDVLRDIGQHQGPAKYLFALGYAGWGAGQLEGEIERHGWFTAPAEPDLVFDAERDMVWEKALARRTREL